MGLIIFVESARSLLQLESICLTAKKLEDKSPLVIEAIVFGSDDFVADIGAERTKVYLQLGARIFLNHLDKYHQVVIRQIQK